MAVNPFEQLRGAPPKIQRTPLTARVTKIDSDGVWAVPLDGDMRHPIGPCRGPASTTVGDLCLIVWTQELPWIYTGPEASDPTPPTTDASDLVTGTLDIARLPVADPGESNAAEIVRSNDPRLSDARTPTDASVTTPKLADGSVTPAKLGDTGWRAVTVGSAAPAYLIRRVGNVVWFQVFTGAVSVLQSTSHRVAVGFRAPADLAIYATLSEDDYSVLGDGNLVVSSGGYVFVWTDYTPSPGTGASLISWPTDEAFPAPGSYPGVAH